MRYEPVIGLEVHAQVKTETKIFCGCSTRFGQEPNSAVCPICLGMPGVLPVLNRKVVDYAIRTGLALSCKVANRSVFARKNYFYPDLPKSYQISQYELPLCRNGALEIVTEAGPKTVGITRIHLEEDAGKLVHPEGATGTSYVDLNRTGVPLMEIVSEPDLRSAEEAGAYLRALHQTLLYLGVCDGNMEEGQFRCDANVSLRPVGAEKFGTRAEIKNVNSFKYVEAAIQYEIARQTAVLDDGGTVVQETRLWNEAKGATYSMRSKEDAMDYRYFPEPDLMPLAVSEAWIDEARAALPELPLARRRRFAEAYELPDYDAQVLTAERALADYFEAAVKAYGGSAKKVSNWVMAELMRELKAHAAPIAQCPIKPESLAAMLRLIDDGTISGKIAKDVFVEMFKSGKEAAAIVEDKGLKQESDAGALEAVIDKVLADNPKEVEGYRGGKTKLMGFFVGQTMKATGGKANPRMVNELLARKLGA